MKLDIRRNYSVRQKTIELSLIYSVEVSDD